MLPGGRAPLGAETPQGEPRGQLLCDERVIEGPTGGSAMRNGLDTEPLLAVRGLNAGFDAGPVLFGIDLEVAPSELIALVGANGAGKSTLLGVLSGLVRATSGTITLGGEDVTNARPEVLVRKGIAHAPQGRRLFGTISVEKNLLLGAYLRRDGEVRDDLTRVLDHFPALKDKLSREAGTLSGGEQQMVAIGRGMMARPKLLMVDERLSRSHARSWTT